MNFKQVRPYLLLEHFNFETIKGKNSAAAGLCNWVVNIVIYRDIVVTVEPKRIALAKATEELNAGRLFVVLSILLFTLFIYIYM